MQYVSPVRTLKQIFHREKKRWVNLVSWYRYNVDASHVALNRLHETSGTDRPKYINLLMFATLTSALTLTLK